MQIDRFVLLTAAALAASSCGTFTGGGPVRMNTSEDAPANRWQGSLSSPQNLAGAVEMQGTAWIGREEGSDQTLASVTIENAAPGGTHPWAVHRGRCGSGQGAYGSAGNLEPLEVGSDGRASATGTLDMPLPTSGDYFIAVYASPDNRGLVVACANLAPPIG